MAKAPQHTDDLTTRVGRLRHKAHEYRDRYGDIADLEPLERLDYGIVTRTARIKQLQAIADEVNAEIRGFELEIEGIQRGIEALLGDVLIRIERQFEEAWSPTPVLGYRIWAMSDNGLHGVRTRWREPSMRAECGATADRDGIPHSDGRCGRLGCGIYAAKSATRLLDEFAPALRSTFAVGLIALSGKVVEHEHGYRGAEATVIALVAVDRMRAVFSSEPAILKSVFSAGGIGTAEPTLPSRAALFEATVTYLSEEERKQNPWT